MIIESGRNTKTKTMSTPGPKLQDEQVLDGRRCQIQNEIDATRFRSVCLGQRWINTGWILLKMQNIWPVVQPMSEPWEFEFVPLKRAVRDSVSQIGNHTSKSGASIQKATALNVGETENSLTDRLEAVQQREHRDTRDILGSGTSSSRRCQYQEGKEAANVGTKPIFASVLQCCSNCRLVFYRTMDPALHYKRKVDEAHDGSGERLQPRCAQRPRHVHRDPQYMHRNPMQNRRHQHRNRNRQLSLLIVNIETDAQTE